MKALFIFLISINIFYGQGLESFLSTGTKTLNEQKKEPKYYIIKNTYENFKAEKKDFQSFSASGETGQIKTAKGYQNANNILLSSKAKMSNYAHDEKRDYIKSIKTNILEELVLKYIDFPKMNFRELKEKIIISFDIDEKKNISNIVFLKPSSYEDINKSFEEAIIKSNQELRAPAKKETKTLYYEFDI